MEEALPGLRDAMGRVWGGGSFGEVLDDGVIEVGTEVWWDDADAGRDNGRLG